jgi:hypothetical protein
LLHEAKAHDASEWVRDHASWASEVALQEHSARSAFRKTLRETDPLTVSAALQVLKPALTPVARWWLYHIRREEEKGGLILRGKPAAVITSFCQHWTSTRSSSVSVAGMPLNDFCRGERLDSLKTPRLFPWWNL